MQKEKSSIKSVDEYIKGYPHEIQLILRRIRDMISIAVPEAEQCLKYGIPTFKLGKNLVHFGGYKNHIGFYPTPSGIKAFEAELSRYKSAKGSVRFPLDQPIPYDLIEKIARFRAEEERGKS